MLRHPSPKRIVCWRLSLHCNRTCGFCLSRSGPRYAHPDHDPTAVADRLRALGVEHVSYSGGEPFLYDQFPRLVDHVARIGLRQHVTTNGDVLVGESIPDWIEHFLLVKLSFYGEAAHHDRLMGVGHFASQLELAGRLARTHGVVVSANYMLTPQSMPLVPSFLRSAIDVGLNDVVFQTYIHTRRRGADRRFALADPAVTLSTLAHLVRPYAGGLPGGIRAHDFSKENWFVVLDERARLTLPASDGMADHVMGSVEDDLLAVPDGSLVPARAALMTAWERRRPTGVIDLG